MENASKALLIAGGLLIAIIIITLLIHTYGNIGSFKRQQLSSEEMEKLEAYNKEYTKYLNQYVYGTDVITVINKVYSSQYPVTIQIKFIAANEENGYAYKYYKYTYNREGKKVIKTYKVKPGEDMTLSTNDSEKLWMDKTNIGGISDDEDGNSATIEGLKNRYFKCTEVGYDNTTGRVNNIKFVEKQVQFESTPTITN